MQNKYLIIFCLLFLHHNFFVFGQKNYDVNQIIDSTAINKKEIIFLKHNFYDNYFNTKYNISYFIIYSMNKINLISNDYQYYFINDKKFIVKNLIKAYTNSGFDRGHLYSAEDASFNIIAYEESYKITNATPQNPKFNGGIWKKLEEYARFLAKSNEIIILTGPVFSENKQFITKNSVKIFKPEYYWKIILNLEQNLLNIYIIENKFCSGKLSDYLVTVEEFENVTGIYLNKRFDNGQKLFTR